MEAKCNSHQYRIAEEFRADAQLIVHNTVIFHGGKLLQEFHYACIIYIAVNFGSTYVGCPSQDKCFENALEGLKFIPN